MIWIVVIVLASVSGCSSADVASNHDIACRVSTDAGTIDYGPCPTTTDSMRSWSCEGPCELGAPCQMSAAPVRGVVVACPLGVWQWQSHE